MSSINLNETNYLVLRKQHLTDDSKTDDIVQIVKDVGGLHATEQKIRADKIRLDDIKTKSKILKEFLSNLATKEGIELKLRK